ncbi:MAG: hypothetical protein HY858_00030 [Candidatus Solibacter usitatus]|nr:hypothetical protein [Candidatus Solibacter usitatus]
MSEPLDVCRAGKAGAKKAVSVRGLGVRLRDGFVLAGITCPVADSGEVGIATVILLDAKAFATEAIENRFRSLKVERLRGTYFQPNA